jgi:hypothetical protein
VHPQTNTSRPAAALAELNAARITPLSQRELRRAIDHIFPLASELDGFILDFFPAVYRQFTAGMDRTTRVNVLFQMEDLDVITQRLRQVYASEVANVEAAAALQATEAPQRVRYTVVLVANVSDLDLPKMKALVSHMRKYASDAELTIEEIRQGSVILICEGSQSGFQTLLSDFSSGTLRDFLGIPISNIVANLQKGDIEVIDLPERKTYRTLLSMSHDEGVRHDPLEASDVLMSRMFLRQPELETVALTRRTLMAAEPRPKWRSRRWAFIACAALFIMSGLAGILHFRRASEPLARPFAENAPAKGPVFIELPQDEIRVQIPAPRPPMKTAGPGRKELHVAAIPTAERIAVVGVKGSTAIAFRTCAKLYLEPLRAGTVIHLERSAAGWRSKDLPEKFSARLSSCLGMELFDTPTAKLPRSVTLHIKR